MSHRENVSRLLTFEAMGPVVTAAKPSPRPTLLVADDSAELRRLVRAAVSASYAEIIEAADGRGLFWSLVRAYYAQPAPAPRLLNLVVLADVRMPVYDGLEVLEASTDAQVRFDLQGPQSPLVFQGHNCMYLAMPRRLH